MTINFYHDYSLNQGCPKPARCFARDAEFCIVAWSIFEALCMKRVPCDSSVDEDFELVPIFLENLLAPDLNILDLATGNSLL